MEEKGAAVQIVVYFGVGCTAESFRHMSMYLCVRVCVHLPSTRALLSVGNSAVGGCTSGWGQGAAV